MDEDSDTELSGLETMGTTTPAVLAQGGKRNAGRYADNDLSSRPIPAHLNSLRRRQWQQDMQRESDVGAHVIIAIASPKEVAMTRLSVHRAPLRRIGSNVATILF